MSRLPSWSSLSLRTKGLIVVALPMLPLAVFWSLTAVTLVRREPPPGEASRNVDGQAALAEVFSAVLDADAGARDHLLTDNIGARARYEEAVARLPDALADFDRKTDDPQQRALLVALRQAVTGELEVLERIVHGQGGGPVLSERAALDRSAEHLETIRELTTTMQQRQASLLASEADRGVQAGTLFAQILLVGSVLCAGSGIAIGVIVAGSVSRRIQILSRNADRLARGRPIHSMPLGDDEIGRLDERFREASRLLRSREAELRARSAELEVANRELEAFSYSVSHDLRAPLRAIDGFSEILEVESAAGLDDTGRDALCRVRRAAARMNTLIDALLDLSRLSRTEVRRVPFDVSGTATAILDDLSRHRPRSAVEVRVEPGLTVAADPHLARIALENLLENAWKYTARTARPRIEVGASPNGAVRQFHVRDNGAGFAPEQADRLFGAFQRLHSDRDFEGTGIGLAIVQRVVHRHGGRIWAEGAEARGASFYFTLEPEQQAAR